jgi:hypothetical protein
MIAMMFHSMEVFWMSNLVVYTATYGAFDRLENFLKDFQRSNDKLEQLYGFRAKISVVNTGDEFSSGNMDFIHNNTDMFKQVASRPRAGRDVWYHKFKTIEGIMKDDDILISFADDIALNAHALPVMWKVYKENEQVNYLSPLMPAESGGDWPFAELSGFPFVIAKSMLGGASSYRWSAFKKYAYEFIDAFNFRWAK